MVLEIDFEFGSTADLWVVFALLLFENHRGVNIRGEGEHGGSCRG